MPTAIGSVMWVAASSPCISVYTPVYAGHAGVIPLEWRTGSDSFDPNSAWWVFEKIQRIAAPEKPDAKCIADDRAKIRYLFDLVEKKELFMTMLLETKAMRLWNLGKSKESGLQLTEFTNANFQSNFSTAKALLNSLEEKER